MIGILDSGALGIGHDSLSSTKGLRDLRGHHQDEVATQFAGGTH